MFSLIFIVGSSFFITKKGETPTYTCRFSTEPKFFRASVFFSLEIITTGLWIYLPSEIGAIPNLLVSIIAAYDAYKIAREINKGIKPEGEDAKEIPEIYIR
ncbi:MAG: hypothetical protein DRO76_03185 [Candidatus Altiarchaeales archaeon]|nr:MAG: hypothetical protein DRO76_03185 [Candidatus Altiarchaeales archaeon]